MNWIVLKSLNELYLHDETKTKKSVLKDNTIQFLMNSTGQLTQLKNVIKVVHGTDYKTTYEKHYKNDFEEVCKLLDKYNLDDRHIRFELNDFKVLIGIDKQLESNQLDTLRTQIIEAKESIRGVSQMFFVNDKYLDKKGVEPNVVTTEGTTPLHLLAGRSEDMDVLNYFIKKGVDANQVDADGNNPMMIAASRNKLEVVQLFEKETKDINTTNKKGETALNNALAGNTTEVVNYLLSEGAEANEYSGKAMIESYKSGEEKELQAKLASLYSEDFNPSGVQADGNTLLHYAAEKNELELVKMVKLTTLMLIPLLDMLHRP